MYFHVPSFGAPVASGQIPEVWLSNCLTVMAALRGSLSGCAQGMNWNAGSSNFIFLGVRPCWLCSEAIASTVAQIALETDATRRESVLELFPRSTSSTIYPCR